MNVLGIDLGGTKLSCAVFSEQGSITDKITTALKNRKGEAVGSLITDEIQRILAEQQAKGTVIGSVGVAVPGIYYQQTGTVWAPDIEGWEEYPLLTEMQKTVNVPVTIDSDRACYILGESWQGNAKGCKNAIYLAVGTGIGAGILINGTVLRGAHDIAGAIGWLALDKPFNEKYVSCGCFEYHASGEGVARVARELLAVSPGYKGELQQKSSGSITAHDVFSAYEKNDPVAKAVIEQGVEFWGMAIANLVSLFNPEKVILGGGVFGPAIMFIPAIKAEATKWAQPISIKKVSIEASALGTDAGLYGAGLLALQHVNESKNVQ